MCPRVSGHPPHRRRLERRGTEAPTLSAEQRTWPELWATLEAACLAASETIFRAGGSWPKPYRGSQNCPRHCTDTLHCLQMDGFLFQKNEPMNSISCQPPRHFPTKHKVGLDAFFTDGVKVGSSDTKGRACCLAPHGLHAGPRASLGVHTPV